MDVKCPNCGRFLAEMGTTPGNFGRTVCRCGVEVAVLVKGKIGAPA